MPRQFLALMLAFALPGFAAIQDRARADPMPPDMVVYGQRTTVPAFEPRSRVQRPEMAHPETMHVTVVRGIRADTAVSSTVARQLEPDTSLGDALAALCRIDSLQRETLALGLPGGLSVPARF